MNGKKSKIQIRDAETYVLIPADNEPNNLSAESESKSSRIELGTTVYLTPHLTTDSKTVYLDFEWERRRLRGFKKHKGPNKQTQKVPQAAFDSITTEC